MVMLNNSQSIQTDGAIELFSLAPTGAFKTGFCTTIARIFVSAWAKTSELITPQGVIVGFFDSGAGKCRFQVIMNSDGTVKGRYDKITTLDTANTVLSYNDGLFHHYALIHNFDGGGKLHLAVDGVILFSPVKPNEFLAANGTFHVAGQSTGALWPGLTTQVSAGFGTGDAQQIIVDELNGVNGVLGAGNPPDLTSPPAFLGTVSWWELPGVTPAASVADIVQNNGSEADLVISGGINLSNVVNDFPSTAVAGGPTGRIINPIAEPIAARIAKRYFV